MSESTTRRVAGIGALGYVVLVSLENMEALANGFDKSAEAIRADYADDRALSVITTTAGALGLVSYLVFAVALYLMLRPADGRRDAWSLAGLIGGIGGPLVAVIGVVTTTILVAKSGGGLSDEATVDLYQASFIARSAAGVFSAAFLLGMGVSGLRSGRLPRWLARPACVLGALAALMPLAAITGEKTLHSAVTVLYGAILAWVLITGLWLLVAEGQDFATALRRAVFLLLVIAAGAIGIGLLAAPDSASTFFSWGLEPAPLAALAGGFYVASATVFALAVGASWGEVRGLVIGAVLLSISVFVITMTHLDIFDFDRLQAWAWVFLFAAFSLVTVGLLILSRGEPVPEGAPFTPWARAVLGVLAVLLLALGIALWIDPKGLAGPSPYELPPLGGRFAGSWIALLGLLCGYAAVRNSWTEGRLPVLALMTFPAGALLAALVTLSDLDPAAVYVAALAALLLIGVTIWTRAEARARQAGPG